MIKSLFLVVVLAATIAAQSTPVIAPTADQQAEFQTALKAAQTAAQNLATAQAQNDVAVARIQATIFRIMAEQRIDPKAYDPQIDKDGKLGFAPKATEVPKK